MDSTINVTKATCDFQEGSECVAISLEQDEDNVESSLPSHFLCPSNLGALLESTTVSLVSGGWKESGEERIDQKDMVQVDGVKVVNDNEVRQEGLEQLDCRSDEQESEVYEISLPADFCPVGKSGVVSELQSPDLPRLIPPVPIYPHITTHPVAHPSPLSLPRATVGETHGQCCNLELDHRHHQLCIAIDEDSPVKYTTSFYHNQSCSSQSACPSAINEGESSGIVRCEYKTHSRNVSETPSLPPFYSSSTSSAYHSRNSSLGSQLSSCFESDSMLNQLTDIDSCLAVHTGSHNDLKHPIRKQDSRYSRRGDSSPSSYSSDLSLHRHMSKPLDRKEAIVNMTRLNLEDTLRNLSLEKVDECCRNISMKSSEWIKRQLESNKDSLVVVKVSSKTKHVVHFNVKAGDVIIWEFATKKKDIAFGVMFEATEVATEKSPIPDSHGSLDDKMSSILPIFRVSTYAHPTIGTHTASLDGVYEIIFDNTYSRFFAKELYYRITTQPSQPNANYFQQ